jgi:uncharacterized protein YjiS (DUF1127 family)
MLRSLFAIVGRWNRRNHLKNTLQKMSNKQLKDIGITRGDIGNIVRGSYTHGK